MTQTTQPQMMPESRSVKFVLKPEVALHVVEERDQRQCAARCRSAERQNPQFDGSQVEGDKDASDEVFDALGKVMAEAARDNEADEEACACEPVVKSDRDPRSP